MAQGKFLHLGQVVVDFSLGVEHLPERGGDIFATRSSVSAGGGYNVLFAARKFGARAQYAGAIGDGPMAAVAREALSSIGVDVIGAQIENVDTGISIALTEPSSERTFVSTRGAETMVPCSFYENLDVTDEDVVYLSGYSFSHHKNAEALKRFARKNAGRKGITLFDVGPMVADISDEDIEMVSLLHPLWSVNERESDILMRRFGLNDSNDYAQRCWCLAGYLKSDVLLRAGSSGAWYCEFLKSEEESEVIYIPTPTVKAIDTNGAGDAHSGVLCAALLEGKDLYESLKLANCAGALSTLVYGPATCPDRKYLENAAALL